MLPHEIRYSSREEWLKLRRGRIGASEVAALFGLQRPYQMSAWTLWQVLAGKMEPPFVGNERTRAGLALEDAIVELAAETRGWKRIRRAGYCPHPKIEGFGASVDFFVMQGRKEVAIAECKNVDYLVWRDDWDDEGPPEHILIQIQAQMACTGLKEAWVCGLVAGNQPLQFKFEASPRIIHAIEEKVRSFMESVRLGKCPPADGSVSTAEAMRTIYTGNAGVICQADQGLLIMLDQLKAIRAKRRKAEEQEREYANKIIETIGDAGQIWHDGNIIATAMSSPRKGYAVEDSEVRSIRFKKIR